MTIHAWIGLGANLDAPQRQLDSARRALASLPGTQLTASSSYYRTAPIGPVVQDDFLNAVCAIETTLTPQALLAELLRLEREHGRIRDASRGHGAQAQVFPGHVVFWGPRTLDLDLLMVMTVAGPCILREPGLTLPHPRMHVRAFVLAPLAEIAPDLVVPGAGSVRALLAQVGDQRCERMPAKIPDQIPESVPAPAHCA